MRKLVLSLFAVFCALGLSAQRQQITGTVTGDDGSPIVGATVVVVGTATGTSTTTGGYYAITAPADATLRFSFMGLETQDVQVGGRTNIDVVLHTDAQQIDDVIVIGYGTTTKGTFTGAASSVTSVAVLKDLPVTTFEKALQGSVAGVQVGVSNGQPGSTQEVRIRGIGSINASNQPLYIVDGVPVNQDVNFAQAGYGATTGVMNTLNPSDIENITVLKDAAATSIYGARAANGVIMVTTKKGRSGDLKVNFKASLGFSNFAVDNRPILNAAQSRELSLEGAYNQAIYNGLTPAKAKAWAEAQVNPIWPENSPNYDWIGAMERTGVNQIYDLSVSGGNDKTTFYTSLGYNKDKGVYVGSDLDVFTSKASINHRSKNWTINYEAYFSKMSQNTVPGMLDTGSVAYANPYYATRTYLRPSIPIYNSDGTFNTDQMWTGSYYNLLSEVGRERANNTLYKIKNSLSVAYEFLPGLSLRETLSFDMNDGTSTTIWPKDSKNGASYEGLTEQVNVKDKKLYSSLVLNYTATFNADHNFSALAGWDVDRTDIRWMGGAASGFASTHVWAMDNGATPLDAYGQIDKDNLISYFGNVNYNYRNKYYLAATYRRDGSSRLGVNTRWGNFWSASASWRISEEDFFDVAWVNSLRLRASYGTTGTLPNAYYDASDSFSYSGSYDGKPASYPTRVANPDLSWETNNTFDLGLEARLFNRWDIEFDFYNRKTTDLILPVNLSLATGFATNLQNVGSMLNRGVELTTGVSVLNSTSPVYWYSQVILSHNKNKILKLVDGEDVINDIYLNTEGKPLYSIRTRDFAGINPANGEMMFWSYEDPNDPSIPAEKWLTNDPDKATRVIVATVDPKIIGSWRNTFAYKGIDLDILLTYTIGGNSWDNVALLTRTNGTDTGSAISKGELNRWQKPGDHAKNPRRMWGGGLGNYGSSYWVHSTDHLRLKQLTLGYTLPNRITKKARLETVRVYMAGNNLLTWAAWDDYDPEVRINGQTNFQIPALKSLTFGIELGF